METQTIQALAAITDEGLFERIATAVLRLVPEYEGLAHTGINAGGKTRKSPVDGLCFLGEGGSRLILAHHTITVPESLERKWLLDPATVRQRPGSKSPLPAAGDVIKTIEIVATERVSTPQLAVTLILATNQEPDEALIRKVVAVGRASNVTIDVWTRSRIAAKLDTDPHGQFIRRKLLGIDAELLSRSLLDELSAASIAAFDAGDDSTTRVARALDARLTTGMGPVTFLAAPSGSGKTVASHKALQACQASGGVALIIPHIALEQALTLNQAVMTALHQLHPSLMPGQNVFTLFSEEDPLLLLMEDVSRSSQPHRLIELLASWAPKAESNDISPWRVLCPVWPHLLGGVRSQLQDRIAAMTLRPEPMTLDEATALVSVCALRAHDLLEEHQARKIAAALGSDPLLIALNRDWVAPRPERVIESFVNDALSRLQAGAGLIAAGLRAALNTLGEAMLEHRSLDPAWNEVLRWDLAPETIEGIRALAKEGEILRIEGSAPNAPLRFRHDRVRDWLLVTAMLHLERQGLCADSTLADPALAEIVGAALVRAGAPDALKDRVQAFAPLALFHGLRVAPVGIKRIVSIAEAAMAWLRNPANHGRSSETLRWEAMVALEAVEGAFMLELISLFLREWPMGLVARLRNGDVEGGVALSARYELGSVTYWTRDALVAASARRPEMVEDLIAEIDGDNNKVAKRRWALIEFAGVLGEPMLAPALERLWARDESRADNLGIYLWAMARCATSETAAQLLDPVCAAWGQLSDKPKKNLPSPRNELAAHAIRSGFELAVPVGALNYFIERAKQPDLSWDIEYMLHGVDHPTAILFEINRSAERLRSGDNSYTFNRQARDHWERGIEGWGTPMSQSSRDVVLELWQDVRQDLHRRRAAFDFWAVSRSTADLTILRAAADDDHLAEQILRQRLLRGDTLAIPALIERLDGERGMYWWFYVRYVWSGSLYKALDRALAREAAKPLPDENGQYEIGSTLTRPLMRLPPSHAEPLLLRYWDKFGETMKFVQAALYIATPKLLAMAASSIAASPAPAKLFLHFTIHYGLNTTSEVGIIREAQIRALAPYLGILRPEDVRDLGDACNKMGWFDLRRELIDPHMLPADLAKPEALRCALDETLEHPHSAWIEHKIDDLRKADVSWDKLCAELRSWLATQPSANALESAKHMILYAGDANDLATLDVWPGTDEEFRSAVKTDLLFAIRRRNRK